jgi:hypothetical protein
MAAATAFVNPGGREKGAEDIRAGVNMKILDQYEPGRTVHKYIIGSKFLNTNFNVFKRHTQIGYPLLS